MRSPKVHDLIIHELLIWQISKISLERRFTIKVLFLIGLFQPTPLNNNLGLKTEK